MKISIKSFVFLFHLGLISVSTSMAQQVEELEALVVKNTGVGRVYQTDDEYMTKASYVMGLESLSNIGANLNKCARAFFIGINYSHYSIDDMMTVPFYATSDEMKQYIKKNCPNELTQDLVKKAREIIGADLVFTNLPDLERKGYHQGLKTLMKIKNLNIKTCVSDKTILITDEFNTDGDIILIPFSASAEKIENFILKNCQNR